MKSPETLLSLARICNPCQALYEKLGLQIRASSFVGIVVFLENN